MTFFMKFHADGRTTASCAMFFTKDFEGRITISCVTCNHSFKSFYLPEVVFNSAGEAVSYPQDPNQMVQTSPVSFMFSIHDLAGLNHHMSGSEERNRIWVQTLSEEHRRLTEEENAHGDILWVNLVDTYRNLPKKLLQFHKEIQEMYNQRFVMKTDDDCFLNIKEIIRGLRGLNRTHYTNVWWSRFRDQWFVERWGKWKELVYLADVYPRFACGTGNIVSNDISQWLAKNADSLHQFQGEDTSMGIWLAAKGVQYIQDGRWQCDNQCTEEALAMSELSVEELKMMWNNKNNCGNACSCESNTDGA